MYETTALCRDVFDFLALLEQCPPNHKGVLPEHPVQRAEGTGRRVKVKRPVAAKCQKKNSKKLDTDSPSLWATLWRCIRCGRTWVPQDSILRTTPPALRIWLAVWDTSAFSLACKGLVGVKVGFYTYIFLIVSRNADHLIERHGKKKKGTYDHMTS